MPFNDPDAAYIGGILTALFVGAYVTVFGLYVKITREKKAALNAIDYGVITLFILCVVAVCIDAVQQFFILMRDGGPQWTQKLNAVTSTLSLTLDFVSQIILIYRCWIVWGRSFWVGAPPAFLALTSYVTGLCVTIDLATRTAAFSGRKSWWGPLGVSSMALSLTVNALVSSLMIARIVHVHRQTRSVLGGGGGGRGGGEHSGRSLLWVSSVLLESALALFVAQLVYLVLYQLRHPAFALVAGPVTVVYGLNCTAIMVRVGLNKSFETTRGSTRSTSLMFGKTTSGTGTGTGTGASQKTYAGSATELTTIPSGSEKRRYGNTYNNGTDTTVVFERV